VKLQDRPVASKIRHSVPRMTTLAVMTASVSGLDFLQNWKASMAPLEIARDLAALDAQVPCAFVLADAVYGSDSRLRRMLEDRHQAYVLAVRGNHHLHFWNEDGLIETNPGGAR
jgi:DDE superfamily endonuclease